jgi:hypothetical protein
MSSTLLSHATLCNSNCHPLSQLVEVENLQESKNEAEKRSFPKVSSFTDFIYLLAPKRGESEEGKCSEKCFRAIQ